MIYSDLSFILGDVTTIIVGKRTNDEPPQLVHIREYDVSRIINDEKATNEILRFLYRVLRFLQENVKQDGTYLLSRRYDHRIRKHGLYLYKVADLDEQDFTFITQQMLNQLC